MGEKKKTVIPQTVEMMSVTIHVLFLSPSPSILFQEFTEMTASVSSSPQYKATSANRQITHLSS